MSKTRMGKRVASLLLSLVMMLSLLPTTVYATGGTGETSDVIVEETNTSDDNTVGGTTGNPELTGEDEGGGGANVSEGETAAVATIGSATYESLDEAITAVADGETIVVNAGEYTLNGSLNYTGKAFTIAAADGADVSFDMSAAVALHGAKITFNDVTFNYKTNGNYIGLQHADTLVYDNCTINGMVFLYAGNETFNGCTFKQESPDAYNVWTYGAQNVAFNGCTFNCVGKAVLVYNEGAIAKTDLTVTDTKFVASAPVTGKAAIEIDTSLMAGGATITVDDKTTDTGFAAGSNSGKTLWNDKKQTADTNKNTTVTVAGEKVFEPKATVVKPVSVNGTSYETLEDAIDAATPDANGVVTYEISGKVDVTATGWVQVAKSGLTGLTAVKFVGTTDDAKICINGGLAILADQNYDIDVSFEALALSKLNPTYGGDYGHSTNYFTTWLRNSGAAENTVTYTNCTFPNGVSNNQYGKTVFDNCKFTNGATGLYNLWNYGGSTEIKNSSFTGTRGIKAYSEGVDGGQIEVADTTFNGLGEKAAIVVSKATTVTLNKVDATECTKGLLQKDIDGGSLKTTIEANGTGISGKFDITATTTADAAKNEFNISAGTFTSEVSNDYCADGFEVKANDNGTYGVVEAATAAGDGTEAKPYTLEQLGAMTRKAYIEAQNRLNGTMYVTVGDYAYDTNGVLGNGVRDDTTGQIPDHSKLNAYGENGYLGEKNDGANGKSVVFVGGSITSGVKGYTSIDHIGTSLLLALPAYTNVTFKGITFNNVMSFNYQLYTSPWSQLGELKFDGCTFNGIIVGAIAAQTLTFNGCEFKNYTNTTDANNSNPTWIRPAYGNWTQGDNEGQGSDFRSLTAINFTDNKVTSTRPVKFEYISQWDITSTVTATGNSFDISKQDGDTAIKNVGLYLGAHTDANAFNLVAEDNTKSANTAALYTIPEGKTSLPLGSTVKNLAGEPVELTDALKWKAGDAETDKIVLETVEAVASVGSKQYGSLQAAIDAVKANETIYVLGNIDLGTDELSTYDVKTTVKNVTIDLGGYTVTSAGRFTVYLKVNGWTIQNGTIQNTNASTTYGTLYVGGSSNSTTLKNLTVESKTNGVQFAIASSKNGIKASITVEDGTKISGNYGVYMKGQPKPWRDTRDGQEILNVNGGEITGTTAAIAVFGAGKGNTKAGVIVNINGGKVYSDSYAIAGNGSSVLENTTINISGGKVFSNKDTAIYHPQAGTVTISGGEVYGVTGGVQMCAGTLNVTGGTISATGNGDVSGKTGDGSIPDGAAVSIVNRAYPAGAPTMTISGGTFTSAAGVGAVQAYGWKNNSQQTWDKPNASVSGGTFSSAVKEEYCATGYIPTANADGTYGVKEGVYVAKVDNVKYETLQAAINAAKRNATVTMLANTRENVTISTPYLTLDLNGFTLNGGTEKGKPALTVTARVTVKDSSTAQTGTIMREDTAENSGVSSHYVIDVQGGGWLTFESGTVKNNSDNANGKGASLVRVGDDRVAKYPGLNIKGGTFTQDNFIVIKVDRGDLFLNGGTLNSKNSYAIEDWHRATIKGGTVNGTVAAWTYSGGYSSSLEISGGTINGDVTSVNYGNADGKKATVAITGGTINGELDTRSYDPKTNKLTSISDATKATIEVTAGTFAKDPTKYLVEGSTVKTNSDGTFGVEKAYLATVGKTSYYTMEEAFKAQTASGEPVVMLRDYTTGSPFNSGTINRTVDLNGYTWTCTGTDTNSAAFEINNPDVTLTVKNGKIVSSQLVGLIPSAMGGTIKYDNAGLVFEDVVMTTTAHSGIETNGNNTNDTVTLKNSTLNVPNGYGIYFPSSGTLTIDNSTINAKTMGVQVCAGSLSINAGSAITVTGDAVPKTENDGAIQDGAAISIVNRTGYKGLGDVTVTGGKFTAKAGNKAIKAYDWANNTETEFTANKTVAVSGGTFSSAVPEGLCAPGFIPTTNGDGTYGVKAGVYVAEVNGVAYATLSEAIAAAKDGDTVKLLRDINTPEISYMISRSLTIDLNGMTVTGSGYDAVFQIDNADAKVVIKNGKVVAVEQSGSAGKYTMAIWASKAGCEVTLEGLDVSQKITHTDDPQMDMIYASGGTITINSGNFVSGTPAWTLNCNDTSYKNGTAKIIVTGGTFVGFDPANNKAEGEGTSFVAAGYVSRMDEDGSYTVVPANAKITVGKRLSIGNDLTITYLVNLTDCTNPWVKFQFYNDDIKGYTTVEVKNYGTATVEGPDGRPVEVFTFDFTGVNPQRMTDTLKATVYAEDASGNVVEYQVADYSVAQYCSNKLAKLGQDDSLRKLIGNLVAYGAAAQVYQNYRTDNLVSTVVSGAVSTDYTDRLSSVTQYTGKVTGAAGVTIKGKTLVLSNTFAVRVYFTVNKGVDIANVSFKVTANGKTDTVNSFEKDEKLGYYYFDYANLNATQLDSEVKFESFVNETGVGDMVTYSVNTYLAKKMPNYDKSSNAYKFMAELFNYGCACTEYASK